jgi:hypothetical protein
MCAASLPSPLHSSMVGLEVSELDRSGSDVLSGAGDLQTPTTGRVTDITGIGSPRPSFSALGGCGLASPFIVEDANDGAEKQRRFEGENRYGKPCTRSNICPIQLHLKLFLQPLRFARSIGPGQLSSWKRNCHNAGKGSPSTLNAFDLHSKHPCS